MIHAPRKFLLPNLTSRHYLGTLNPWEREVRARKSLYLLTPYFSPLGSTEISNML